MATSDVLTAYPLTLRASTTQPEVLYRRQLDLIAIHGRVALPRDLETVLAFDDPPVVVCRLGAGPVPRDLAGSVSAVYALAPHGAPVVPTGRVLVRFAEGVAASERDALFSREGFVVVEPLPYAPNAAWVTAASGGMPAALGGVAALEAMPGVVNVERQMLRGGARR